MEESTSDGRQNYVIKYCDGVYSNIFRSKQHSQPPSAVLVGVVTDAMCQHVREVSGRVQSVVHAVHDVQTKLSSHGGPVNLEQQKAPPNTGSEVTSYCIAARGIQKNRVHTYLWTTSNDHAQTFASPRYTQALSVVRLRGNMQEDSNVFTKYLGFMLWHPMQRATLRAHPIHECPPPLKNVLPGAFTFKKAIIRGADFHAATTNL